MTTAQLTKLKEAGFSLEQIIVIGGIFDPEKPPYERLADKTSILTEAERKIYEKARKEVEEEQRRRDWGPAVRGDSGFDRRVEALKEANKKHMCLLGSMEIPKPLTP